MVERVIMVNVLSLVSRLNTNSFVLLRTHLVPPPSPRTIKLQLVHLTSMISWVNYIDLDSVGYSVDFWRYETAKEGQPTQAVDHTVCGLDDLG